MLEKAIEQKLRKGMKAIGGLCLKWESPGFTGVPDRMILLPGGCVFFVETKAPGKKERKRQEYVHKQLRALGFTVYATVDSEAKVEEIVSFCRRQATQKEDALTLAEAIQHLNELLETNCWPCEQCKNEHEQLLSWLLELRERRKGEADAL